VAPANAGSAIDVIGTADAKGDTKEKKRKKDRMNLDFMNSSL
jgi:hypothetical protein